MALGDDDASLSSGDSSNSGEDWEQGGDGYSVEYSLWMLKFLCPKEGCGGTLAPPTTTAVVMEARLPRLSAACGYIGLTRLVYLRTQCNYCGHERTDAEFYEALEAP